MNIYIEIIAILVSPIIAVWVGQFLQTKNHYKIQREDLIRRLIGNFYQMSPTYKGEKKEILKVLNEIKYWYSEDPEIKNTLFDVMKTMEEGQINNSQDKFIKLIQKITEKEGKTLTEKEIEKVISTK